MLLQKIYAHLSKKIVSLLEEVLNLLLLHIINMYFIYSYIAFKDKEFCYHLLQSQHNCDSIIIQCYCHNGTKIKICGTLILS